MRKMIAASLIILVFVILLVGSVYASSIKAGVEVDHRLYVNLEFSELNDADYSQIAEKGEFEVLNLVALSFKRNLEQQNIEFNNENKSVKITFYLSSYGILDVKINTEKANKQCKVRTDWRKVRLNLSDTVSFDLSEYFGIPVAQWQNSTDDKGRIHFLHNYDDPNISASFSFTLPSSARNVHFAIDKETILFELPLSFEDQLLNSPVFVLIILILIVCSVLIYRKIVK